MKKKNIQDTYLQTLSEIKNIHRRSKSDSALSIRDNLEANLADDEEEFLTIQDDNQKLLKHTTLNFIVFGLIVCFDAFERIFLLKRMVYQYIE